MTGLSLHVHRFTAGGRAEIERARIEAAADAMVGLVGVARTLSALDDAKRRVVAENAAMAAREGFVAIGEEG